MRHLYTVLLTAWSALLVAQVQLSILIDADQLATPTYWDLVREDLQEYVLQSAESLRNYLVCLAKGVAADSDAVAFDDSTGLCRTYSCVWGKWGCRKCRNVLGSDGQLLWVRPLLQSNRKTCWRTFQHRVDDSVLFNRSWNEYKVGFGQGEQRNFWLGLDALHEATKDGSRRVRWELNTWPGDAYWSENEFIIVASEAENYTLSLGPLDTNKSTLGMDNLNHFRSMNGKAFSTYDRDNDVSTISCAEKHWSAGWFGNCFYINPNGRYVNFELTASAGTSDGLPMMYVWPGSTYPFVNWYSHRRFECLYTEFI